MRLFCLGLSHKTAPLEVRERLALGFEDPAEVLAKLRADTGLAEAVWLATCHRVEIYGVLSEPAREPGVVVETLPEYLVRRLGGRACRSFHENAFPAFERLLPWFMGRPGVSRTAVAKALYVHESTACVKHLVRVSAGLDSMVLGETEVLGQVKESYELARRGEHAGRELNLVFQGALRVAKQVRSETDIQRGTVSVASLAVDLAENLLGSLAGRHALVLGAGDTAGKVVRALVDRGVREVRIGNRSLDRGQDLASAAGPSALAMADWSDSLASADVVVGSTAAPGFVLHEATVEMALSRRAGRPLLLLDLAMPRDIDPAISRFPTVRLFNLDDLQELAERHLRTRRSAVVACEAMASTGAEQIMRRLQGGLLQPRALATARTKPSVV